MSHPSDSALAELTQALAANAERYDRSAQFPRTISTCCTVTACSPSPYPAHSVAPARTWPAPVG